MTDREVAALRSELLRLSADMSKGMGAFQVMLAQRDAQILVLGERIQAMRQTFDEQRRAHDTASHDLVRVRMDAAVEAARRHEASAVGERWARYALTAAKVAAVASGPAALLWQALK
jgi:hypothetical protein